MLRLEKPEEKHRDMYNNMIKSWSELENIPVSPSALFDGDDFTDFLKTIAQRSLGKGRWTVKAYLFLLIEDENIIGAIDIRHTLGTPALLESHGHIGYGIAPKYRRKGYATKMLALGLDEARKTGLEKVLVCCDLDNIGSKKTILSNQGIFERLTEKGDSERYWIDIK